MLKRLIIVLVSLAGLFLAIAGVYHIKEMKIAEAVAMRTQMKVNVTAAPVEKRDWHSRLHLVGSLKAVNGVDISSEVSGKVVDILFKSGQYVKEGQALIQLDDSTDKAELTSDEAQLALDKQVFERNAKLLKSKSVSQDDYDRAKANYKKTQALVAKTQAMIAKKRILAPFSGRVGIRQVDLGQYVSPGQFLVTLQSLDPLYVDFYVPELKLKDLYVDQPVEVTVEAYPNEKLTGKVAAINAEVEQASRTILVRSVVQNEDHHLYPGSFANVTLFLAEKSNVIVVPQTAVTYSLYGDSVFVVQGSDNDKKVIQRFVTLGPMEGAEIVVEKGLKEGEEVVTSGQLKLRSDMPVEINNSVTVSP